MGAPIQKLTYLTTPTGVACKGRPSLTAVIDPGDGYLPAWGGLPIWDEQFNGSSIDTSKWNVREGSQDAQDYSTMRAQNVTVSGGRCTIAAKRESYTPSSGTARPWTSGYIDTIGKFSQKYGRWEMRAILPVQPHATRGTWPSFWLRDSSGGGECDIFEACGSDNNHPEYYPARPSRWSSSVYQQTGVKTGSGYTSQVVSAHPEIDPSDGQFHLWAMEWTPSGMTFFVDNVQTFATTPAQASWVAAGFTAGANIRIDLFMGSSWLGHPDDASGPATSPCLFVIDHVRVWGYTP